ncbi:MAG: hypothetical protein KF713_13545 [Turneriella sp.]|nr:hypothetical protein [Turneriella sp.]
MKFFGDADKSLSLLPSGVAEGKITLTAQLFEGGRELWSKKISTYADEIKAVAAWLENFWEPCADVYLGSLRFIYSHREHIGEGYYTIAESNSTILYVYEQLGTSNIARAQELRGLLG